MMSQGTPPRNTLGEKVGFLCLLAGSCPLHVQITSGSERERGREGGREEKREREGGKVGRWEGGRVNNQIQNEKTEELY